MAAALEAASHGYSVALAAPEASTGKDDRRTTALMMPAVRMLGDFEVWPTLAGHATPLRTMRLIDGSSRLMRAPTVSFTAGEIDEDAFGYNIANSDLNGALLDAVAATPAITVVPAMASSATFGDDGCTVALSDGQTLDARLAVAADGINSLIREAAGIGVRRWSYPQTAVVLTFAHTRSHEFISTEFHTETGPFTTVPMQGNRSSLVWVLQPDEAERVSTLDREDIAALVEKRMDSMLGAISEISTPQCWPLSGMIAHRFAGRRMMLVGQAAHVFPPIGAQGLNLGFRDIEDLGTCLAAAPADPGSAGVTARYHRMRGADILTRTGAVDLLNRSLLTDFLPVQFARAAGIALLSAVSPLRSLAMREGMAPGSGLRTIFGRRKPLTETGPEADGPASSQSAAR
jgi:2-octaprenyl-6-methoxyphenol hydroxylase